MNELFFSDSNNYNGEGEMTEQRDVGTQKAWFKKESWEMLKVHREETFMKKQECSA